MDVDLGFRPESASAMKVVYDDGGKGGEQRAIVMQEMLRVVSAIPGVRGAGIADMLPLGRNRSWGFAAKDRVYKPNEPTGAIVRIVTPGYLPAMGMGLTSGRDFSWQDASIKPCAVIINEAAARRHWPDQDALGRIARAGGPECRVIGIVADVKQHSVEGELDSEMYLPVWQGDPEGSELVVRSNLPPTALAGPILKALRELNPTQPAERLRPVREIVDRAVSPRRFFVLLVSSFAALGLVLACIGIFGVISYSVTRRTQEIGIRMALGASGGAVQMQVVASAMKLSLVGILIGAVASVVATRWIASMLFATKPTDAATFAAIAAMLAVVALIAAYVPARRASRIEPLTALRVN
jgi:predicted permease